MRLAYDLPMSQFATSGVLAAFLGLFLIPVLFVPYVAWTYHRHGTFGWGHVLIAVATVVYGIALWTYTIVPLPDPATMDCSKGGPRPQLIPFGSLADIHVLANGVHDPALIQLVANIALFIPFGMLVRYLVAPRRPAWIVLAALGVSLFIELTQLTGVWGIYPCAYRVFDVDDLITNTAGAALGVMAAPLLRFVPGQRELPEDQPRIVTRGRRLVGMAVDFVSVQGSSLVVYLPLAIAARDAGWFGGQVPYDRLLGWITLAVSAILLLVVPWAGRGATLGQRFTFVRPVDTSGARPRRRSILLRWATGSGGYFVMVALGAITGRHGFDLIATVWLVAAAAVVVLRHPRGVSGYVSGQMVTDARDKSPLHSRASEVDPRSMGIAVVALVAVGYLGFSALAALAALAPAVGAGFVIAGAVVLFVASMALVPFLVGAGVRAVRREGAGVITLLPLVVAAAIVTPLVLLGVGIWTGVASLVVATLAVLAVLGYFGFLFIAFLAYGQWYAHRRPAGPVDAVVVLGSRVFGERVPPLLAARIDLGIEVLDEQMGADPGSPIVLVCSGGQGPDETMPEGEAMARYAAAHGVAEDRLFRETASRDTRENLTLTRRLLEGRGLGTRMVAVTNDFHAFRASIIARGSGIAAQVIGAPTAHYYFPAAVIREFAGVLALSPAVHAVVGLVLALTVGALGALILL